MEYHYIERDAIARKTATPTIVRKAVKQSKSLAVLATEEPTGEQRQVLLMVGRQGRERIPVVLNDDSTVANIVGSCLVRSQTDRLVGVMGWATDSDAQAARARYEAGELSLHLTTKPITGVELRAGETFQGVTGPAMVLTAWEPLQVVLSD